MEDLNQADLIRKKCLQADEFFQLMISQISSVDNLKDESDVENVTINLSDNSHPSANNVIIEYEPVEQLKTRRMSKRKTCDINRTRTKLKRSVEH